MTRDTGFYWCKKHAEWLVAEWQNWVPEDELESSPEWGGTWHVPGVEMIFKDHDWEEIDERQLIR